MCNGGTDGQLAPGTLDIHMDPLVIISRIGKTVDAVLIDRDPV